LGFGVSDNTPNISKLVKDYLARFPYVYKIHRDLIYYGEIKEWCEQNFKKEFNQWFWWSPGKYDDHANLHIQRENDNTLFLLKWGDKL
jgi:hypothetical protein